MKKYFNLALQKALHSKIYKIFTKILGLLLKQKAQQFAEPHTFTTRTRGGSKLYLS